MPLENLEIDIPLFSGKSIKLKIKGSSIDPLYILDEYNFIESEAIYQIVEGKNYDYAIEEGYTLKSKFHEGLLSPNKFDTSYGVISPNIYVGTLAIDVYHKSESEKCGTVKIEVRSIKVEYRTDYKKMLSDITEQCIELIFQHSSPVTQTVEVNYERDNQTWHQRFAFIQSLIDTEEFNDAINKIIYSPITKWKESNAYKDIRCTRRLNSSALRQIASAQKRIELPAGHPMKTARLGSIPSKINIANKTETVDTPENRFIKHVLQSFLFFVSDFKSKIQEESKIQLEAISIENRLEQFLSHSLFKEISDPRSILLNSPVLQRKEGYREILKIWFMFNLAAKLTWKGGDDVYDIGKRNVAALYEYWVFFELLKITEKVFGIKPSRDLIVDTNDTLGLQLKQGVHFPVSGICSKYNRKLNVQFSYNRTFGGSSTETNYPRAGSWTKSMRPDYTLSFWPQEISEEIAEQEELIIHIHFDAKYRVENILESLGEVESLDKEREEQNKGTYKRADLLKMHAYKDAIRRTGGAYVLYPGNEKITYKRMGFRELIPGLGAFQIRPTENNDNGSKELELFIEDVLYHYVNRASQREKTAFRIYDIHKDIPQKDDEIREPLPESYNLNRGLIPDETFVIVGYSSTPERFKWYEENRKYIFRMGVDDGSLELSNEVVSAKYLLLRQGQLGESSCLYKITSSGPKVFSSNQLSKIKYPLSKKPKDFYLVIEIERVIDKEFMDVVWKYNELAEYKSILKGKGSPISKIGRPFTVSLKKLMKVIKK